MGEPREEDGNYRVLGRWEWVIREVTLELSLGAQRN